MRSVLQTWVTELPLREQGVLVLALRGPDGVRKEHGAKNIIRALRGCVMVTGVTGQPLIPGFNLPNDSFMQMYRVGHPEEGPWQEALIEFFRCWDEYNAHFLFHLLHAAEILGYRHPHLLIRGRWHGLYAKAMQKCHVNPETFEQMIERLKDGPRAEHEE